MNAANDGASAPTLYHDGCNVCLGIAETLSANMPGLTIVDLGLHPELNAQALALGVAELPSLVLGAKVLPIAPHSRIGAH